MYKNLELLKKNKKYYVKFLDHNLRTRYDNDLSEIFFEFNGWFKEDSENVHNFYLMKCSDDSHSDIFQVVKGTIIELKEIKED